MTAVAILAIGAESPLGSGRDAYRVGGAGEAPRSAIVEEPRLVEAGLKKPFLARAALCTPLGEDRAAALLASAAAQLARDLDERLPGWRTLRVGLAVGTSSGGMLSLTEAFALRSRGADVPPALARGAPYFGPLSSLGDVLALGAPLVACVQVLAACASSAVALGLGARWLELGVADVVIAGGYDAVSVFVAAGFECIGATSASRPAPFREPRDGMALGEAAVLFALAPPGTRAALGTFRGFGASCDAVHVTAPDRTGDGLSRAAVAALRDAAVTPASIGLISAHATATPFNDAAESRALGAALGPEAARAVVHPFKAVVGHTLGASAALELAAALDAMASGVLPAAAGEGALMPEFPARLLSRNEAGDARVCLKLSAAFAGCNAALVVSSEPATVSDARRPVHPVLLTAVGPPRTADHVTRLEVPTRIPETHLSRLDALSAACVAASASVSAALAALPFSRERIGVIVGSAASVIENNDAFDRRLREQGARAAEPRRFPATSPNVPAGQCAIALDLRGPAFAVGAGPAAPFEALLVAWDLIAAGDADAFVVIAAEDAGPAVEELWRAAGLPEPQSGALAAVLSRGDVAPGAIQGAILDRERLWSSWNQARDGRGSLGAARPGYPAFQAALSELEKKG